jgi:large subunit ribosomal protein L24
MKVKKNDTVVVITGKDVKKTGKVLVAFPQDNKIIVEGVNVQEKNRKARSAQETSQKIKKEGPIDASNVLVICPVCGKATRVGYEIVDGKKVRICKKCKASLDTKVAPKEEPKKRATKKSTKVAETDVTEAPATEEVKPARKRRTTKTSTETTGEVKEVKKASTRKKAVKKDEETAE